MLTHSQPIEATRSAIDHITGRTEEEQRHPVPNCPGWRALPGQAFPFGAWE